MDKSDEKSGLVKRKGKRSEREAGRGGRRGEGRRVERREEKEGRRVERERGGWSHLKRPRGGEEEMSEGQGEVRRNAVTVDRGPVPRAQVLQSPTGTTKTSKTETAWPNRVCTRKRAAGGSLLAPFTERIGPCLRGFPSFSRTRVVRPRFRP